MEIWDMQIIFRRQLSVTEAGLLGYIVATLSQQCSPGRARIRLPLWKVNKCTTKEINELNLYIIKNGSLSNIEVKFYAMVYIRKRIKIKRIA